MWKIQKNIHKGETNYKNKWKKLPQRWDMVHRHHVSSIQYHFVGREKKKHKIFFVIAHIINPN